MGLYFAEYMDGFLIAIRQVNNRVAHSIFLMLPNLQIRGQIQELLNLSHIWNPEKTSSAFLTITDSSGPPEYRSSTDRNPFHLEPVCAPYPLKKESAR